MIGNLFTAEQMSNSIAAEGYFLEWYSRGRGGYRMGRGRGGAIEGGFVYASNCAYCREYILYRGNTGLVEIGGE